MFTDYKIGDKVKFLAHASPSPFDLAGRVPVQYGRVYNKSSRGVFCRFYGLDGKEIPACSGGFFYSEVEPYNPRSQGEFDFGV